VTVRGTAVSNGNGDADRELRRAVHARLVASDAVEWLADAPSGELHRRLEELLVDAAPLLPAERRERLVAELADEVSGFGGLEPLLADPTVTEVMVNGPGRCYVERDGRLVAVPCSLDERAILRIIERILAPLGLRLDRASPMVDARLPDGSRLHAVIPPLAIDGPCLTVRRFGARAVAVEDFDCGADAAAFLRAAVAGGWNLVVAGGTSSGKTTLLNALSGAIDPAERIVSIEETAELRLPQPHVVRLEARPANAEGAGGVSVRDLVRAALRMRPDRLVVGEVRGAEALDLVQALNTGHDGSISTVHANTPVDALRRLVTLALFAGSGLPHDAVRDQLSSSVDGIVQVARGPDGRRRIVAIDEVGPPGRPLATRPLFARRGAELVAVEAPGRARRRVAGAG
jgi:pilus assembly protein CpaF